MFAISYIPDQPGAKVHASLRSSLAALEEAHQCSVLWFGEVMRRGLFRDLGHSSINLYAIQDLGYTKAREIISMATPETQDTGLKVAKGIRKELIREVKMAKRTAVGAC